MKRVRPADKTPNKPQRRPLFRNSKTHNNSADLQTSIKLDNSISVEDLVDFELKPAKYTDCNHHSTPARNIQRKVKRTSCVKRRHKKQYEHSSVDAIRNQNDQRLVTEKLQKSSILKESRTESLSLLLSDTIDNNDCTLRVDTLDTIKCSTAYSQNQSVINDDILNQCLSTSSASILESIDTFDSKNIEKEVDHSKLFKIMNNTSLLRNDTLFATLNITEIVSSAVNDKNRIKFEYSKDSFYGLPLKAHDILKDARGISQLYDWQHACLSLSSVFERKNMVYSLPTSGGKTLVAEIIIMKELLINKKSVILVLPYVSIVQEKVRGLSPFAVDLGFHIEEYAASKGPMPPKKRRKKKSIYIATIEKANAIVNSLIELERKEELGMVVVDELHMIGEGGGRGALLETLLSKLLYAFAHVQIIGMSATLGNMDEIKRFLNAEIYSNDFRPVELTEYVKIEDVLYKLDPLSSNEDDFLKKERTIAHHEGSLPSLITRDPDHLLPLVIEVIPENSCLVFCATKKNCESVASMLAEGLPKTYLDVKRSERLSLLKTIRETVNGVCKILLKTIPYGIAYHHSGLTMDERKLVEESYCAGTLCLLCCTSTLAAGVNLPAKRVILRSPYVGCKFLSRSQYKQMIGRAGRAGIDTSGESVLILPLKDKVKAAVLLDGPVGTCKSSLFFQDGKGLRQLILSLLGLKLCSSLEEIVRFLRFTLFHVQNNVSGDVIKSITDELEHLIKIELIRKTKQTDDTNLLETTDLGRATLKGCVDIDLAPFLYKQLTHAQNGLVLANDLQLLYLATPLDQVHGIRINWMTYYKKFGKLNTLEMKASEFIGIRESLLCRKATGQRYSKINFDEFTYKRFYLTLMLFDLMKQQTIWQVSGAFDVARGFLQNLLSSATSFTSQLIHFTEELSQLWAFKLLFQALLDRLTNTNNLELVALLEIPGVKQARARQLFKSGYRTLQDIAWADASKLCQEIEFLPRKQAQLIIASAKMLLQERIETLRDEADEISANPQVHRK